MKKITILTILAVFAALFVTGCASKPKSTASNSKSESKKRVIFVTDNGFSKNLMEVVTIPTPERTSAFVKASEEAPVDLMAFYMSQSEITYARWYEVLTWAKVNGYTFANPGREGSSGVDGAAPTGANLPVTMISWRDALVWCNAASEKDGLTPVYKYNGAVLKEADKEKEGAGKAENAVVDPDATGYRLPTAAEWEFAARGGDPEGDNWTYLYSLSNSSPDSVAWYAANSNGAAQEVMTKEANSFGMYDMNGNVWEWCYDSWASSNQRRAIFGGCYKKPAEGVTVTARDYAPVTKAYEDTGFRVVKFALSQRYAK